MKTIGQSLIFGGLLAVLSLTLPVISVQANCGSCGVGGESHTHKKHKAKGENLESASAKGENCAVNCPLHMHGGNIKVENTKDGAVIALTSNDPEIVKKIQANAATLGSVTCSCCTGDKKK